MGPATPRQAAAAEVRRLRRALRLTQVEAAAAVGKSRNHFAGYEQARANVPFGVLQLLRTLLQLDNLKRESDASRKAKEPTKKGQAHARART